jgi:hypothetical protein
VTPDSARKRLAEGRAVPPPPARRQILYVAKRMGAHTFDVDSSHVPMLSHPELVVDVIRGAAESLWKN